MIKAWRIIIPAVYGGLFAATTQVFFSNRGGWGFLQGVDFYTANRLLFPLMGLYAFFLVWAQIVTGSTMRLLRRVYPNIKQFHIRQGIFTLVFVILHPTMLMLGIGFKQYYKFSFVDPSLIFFVWLGYFQFFLILCTAITALLRHSTWLQNKWRLIHYANYVVFVSVWIHSWFLGSDIRSGGLQYIWIFYGLTFLIAVIWRFKHLLYSLLHKSDTSPTQV